MDRFLTIFMYVWVGIFVALNLVGIVFEFYSLGFNGGIEYVQKTYSPFNLINWTFTLITLSPALGAHLWLEKRRKKALQEVLYKDAKPS